MSLPKEIFVTRENEEDEGGYLTASETAVGAVQSSEKDTPTVGTYQLVTEETLKLVTTTTHELQKLQD